VQPHPIGNGLIFVEEAPGLDGCGWKAASTKFQKSDIIGGAFYIGCKSC